MQALKISYKHHRFPTQIVAHVVCLYARFNLSLREVEEMTLARGVDVAYETIRRWTVKFGPLIAHVLRRRQPRPGVVWLLDEVVVKIAGRSCWRWRAVDQHGVVLEVLLGAADIVSLHVTLSPSTHHLIGKAQLTAMKSTALLINTSRAGVVDTAELIAHLHAGTIAGAAVDVFDDEPAPRESPLFTAPNTVLTPHLGYVTEANYARYYNDAVEDIRYWLDGSPVRVLVGPGG